MDFPKLPDELRYLSDLARTDVMPLWWFWMVLGEGRLCGWHDSNLKPKLPRALTAGDSSTESPVKGVMEMGFPLQSVFPTS